MRFVSKSQLKKDLPLAFVVASYGVLLDPDTCTGQCPFHQDAQPSFRLYVADDGVTRWHCFPCQEGGDVYDFIMKIDPACGAFPEALNRAEELYHNIPRGWLEDPNRPQPSKGYDASATEDLKAKWPLFVQATTNRAARDSTFAAIAGLIRHDEYDDRDLADLSTKLVSRWRWGVDDSGVISVPHYAPGAGSDAVPTGVKLRAQGPAGSRKWALPGSKYPYLYGSWLEPKHNYVLLTEGESDCVWADLQPHAPCDVRALPSGASSWSDAWPREMLATWDKIFLCLDPDEAGVTATRRWLDAFFDITGPNPVQQQIWICSLPAGRDLRDARPDLRRLLDEAVLPPEDRGAVIINNERFERVMMTQQGPQNKQLTSWYFEPSARLRPNHADGLSFAYEANLHVRGAVTQTTINSDDMSSKNRFALWTGREGLATVTNDSDVMELNAWAEARAAVTPEKYQTRRLGIHAPPDQYHWAGPSLVLPPGCGPKKQGYMGHLPWIWRGMPEYANGVYFDEAESKQPMDYGWLKSFLELSEPGFTEPLLGWLIATVRRPEMTHFPILSITGSSGSGKSTIARLALQLMGSRLFGSLSGDTPMKLQVLCSSTTSVPVFVDEWTKISRQISLETMKSIITYIYEGGSTEKYSSGSRIDRDVYTFTSPLLLAGEMEFIQTREIERMIPLTLWRSKQNPDALEALLDKPLHRFGWYFNEWFIRTQREDPGSLPPLPMQDPDGSRASYNQAVVQHGWDLLKMFLQEEVIPNVHDPSSVPVLGDEPSRAMVNAAFDDIRQTNSYDEAVGAAYGVRDTRYGTAVSIDDDGRGTWINARLVCRIARDMDIDLPGGERAMLNYLRERCRDTLGEGEDFQLQRRYDPLTTTSILMRLIPGYYPPGHTGKQDARETWTGASS